MPARGGDILTLVQRPDSAKQEKRDCAYNLFRNRQRPDLLCAVPSDHVVPRFLNEERWLFDRSIDRSEAPPPGFCDRAASTGVRFSGFYLFQLTAVQDRVEA
jgi:hypothetical protein